MTSPIRRAIPGVLSVSFLVPTVAFAQEKDDIKELKLRDWQPRSMLITKATEVSRPAFPVIDVHNHLGGGKATLTPERVGRYLAEMDAAGVRAVVNLDGGWGERLKETIAALDKAHPGRFLTYALIDFSGLDLPGWSDREAARLRESFEAGAKGLKFHKSLGLGVRYKDGRFLAVDDPKLDPIWEVCAAFKRPVEIHTGDPGAFFTPLDRFSERWHELNQHPEWLFHGKDYPQRRELHAQRMRVIGRHPNTTFICAHMANDGEDLAEVGRWLDAYPNMYVDIDARISELGRQPYSARRFFLKYQDRVMFGTDTAPNREAYRIYYRFLETDDEYFDPAGGHHRQGFWMIYGVFLPKDVLEKLYLKNAERLLVGLKQDRDTKVQNDRKAFATSKDWIYNDLAAATRIARDTHKPLMVVFRCIPCEACQEFDDDVARRDPIIRDLMDDFICVRVVQANAMDLSHFQFDFDQSLAVLFMNADLMIYGRFGTRSDRPEQEDISLEGLRKAMGEALRMHRHQNTIMPSLVGKQVKPSRFKTPRDYPNLAGRYQRELDYSGSAARSCIHCHQVREAERRVFLSAGESLPDSVLFPYPDPAGLGLSMDPKEMAKITRVAVGSSAASDGIRAGDEILTMDGQPLLSVADLQWVLHNAPAAAVLPAQVRRGGETIDLKLTLRPGWRNGNISWRATTWDLRRAGLGGMKLESLNDEDHRRAGVPPDGMALRIAYVGEFGEHAVAKRAGLQKGDVVVSFDGKHDRMTESELLAYVLQQKRQGDTIVVEIIRDGGRSTKSFALPSPGNQ